MKKLSVLKNAALAAALALLAVGQAQAASGEVDRAAITLSSETAQKNSTVYVTVTAFDADSAQMPGLKPMASVSPTYAASVGAFVSCDTAEGREACAAAGNGLEGLAGAYVAKVATKDVDGDARIGVYLPGKFVSATLKVGAGAAAAVAVVSAEAAPKASAAKAGGGAQGTLLALAMLAAVAVPAYVWSLLSGKRRA